MFVKHAVFYIYFFIYLHNTLRDDATLATAVVSLLVFQYVFFVQLLALALEEARARTVRPKLRISTGQVTVRPGHKTAPKRRGGQKKSTEERKKKKSKSNERLNTKATRRAAEAEASRAEPNAAERRVAASPNCSLGCCPDSTFRRLATLPGVGCVWLPRMTHAIQHLC